MLDSYLIIQLPFIRLLYINEVPYVFSTAPLSTITAQQEWKD